MSKVKPIIDPPTSFELRNAEAAENADASESLIRFTMAALRSANIPFSTEAPRIQQVFCIGIAIGLRIAEARRLKKEWEGTF